MTSIGLQPSYQRTWYLSNSFLRCVRSTSLISQRRSRAVRYAPSTGYAAGRRRDMGTRKRHPFALLIGIVLPVSLGLAPSLVNSAPTGVDPGIGNVPQGTQSDQTYADSFAANHVTNVFVTNQQVSCYRPEVPFAVINGPNDGYTGEASCPGATTGENTGSVPYPSQAGSEFPYPAAGP